MFLESLSLIILMYCLFLDYDNLITVIDNAITRRSKSIWVWNECVTKHAGLGGTALNRINVFIGFV